jgi:hypothetical protein
MRISKQRILYIGAIISFVIAFSSIWWSIATYTSSDNLSISGDLKDYLINVRAEVFGVIAGAGFSLMTVLISLAIDTSNRRGALNSARFLFLRSDVESFKEALIRYVDAFRLGNGVTAQVSQASWESFDKKFWPQKDAIKQMTNAIHDHDLANTYTIRAVKLSIDNLWEALQKIVTASATNIFEGKEHLVNNAVFTALFELGSLQGMIPHTTQGYTDDDEIDLSILAQRIKSCGETCSKVLEDMAELATSVKTK